MNATSLIIGLGILPVLLEQGHYRLRAPSETPQEQAYREVHTWVRQATPANAMILVPLDLDGFQLDAQRRIWVNWKQGAAVMWAPSFYTQWSIVIWK